MSDALTADFERQFPGGPLIRAQLHVPIEVRGVTVLFGPSGGGKTTILRCLAGLDRPGRGTIRFGTETWFDAQRSICLPPQKRGIGYLIQEYALFPHLTVAENLGYGLRGLERNEKRKLIAQMADLAGLAGMEKRFPRQLSGGQQQRLALARALACRPRLLLLDEPLSALDGPTRAKLRRELYRLFAQLHVPVVLVTHDQEEALLLGDWMVIVEEGRIAQTGPILDVFSRPTSLSIARQVGFDTIVPGQVLAIDDGLATVAAGTAKLTAVASNGTLGDCYVCIRAEDVILQVGSLTASSARNRLAGRVVEIIRAGPMVQVWLDCGFALAALITQQSRNELDLREGSLVTALLKAPAIHLIRRLG
jgi:molybdate transport system ATP-binding protein